MKRRKFLSASFLGLLGASALGAKANERVPVRRCARFVHLTDMHIHSGYIPERGIRNLLEEIDLLEDKPDFVINSGDNIMDGLKRSKEDTAKQWKAWHEYFRSKLNYDMHSCIGNHDVWGWGLNDSRAEEDILFGKNLAVKELGIPNRYYSFDRAGWHFIFLDSVLRNQDHQSYQAKLDDDQFEWLSNDLEQTAQQTPICVVSHIPILSASVFFDGNNEKNGSWNIPGAWMHLDARRLKDLFAKHPNIKMALSGHVHLADRTSYLGIDYLCNGAACGAWWFGRYQEFPPMYAIIDLFEDGSYKSELVHYNWKNRNLNNAPVVNNSEIPAGTSALF